MQPYVFPYLGYFQLINAVDIFVVYDDVNFIKQGWINRNRILLNDGVYTFNIILKGASSFKKISEIEVEKNNLKLIKTIETAYRKAPYFNEIYPLIKSILSYNEINLAKYLTNSLRATLDYLNINKTIVVSSSIEKDPALKGADRVIDICQRLNATTYINAIGGIDLYSREKFSEKSLILNFIKLRPIVYPQFKDQFFPNLSIIDVLMFNTKDDVKEMLNQYELV